MTSILLSLLIPAIICALPFMALFKLVKVRAIKNSALMTGITVLVLTLLNTATSLLALKISIFGLKMNLPKDEPQCISGAAGFIVLSFFFELLTVGFGVVYTYRHYKLQKILQEKKSIKQN